MSYVTISAEVAVEVGDVLEQLSERDLARAFKDHMPKQGISVPMGLGIGDVVRAQRIVEAAYQAARQMPQLPREIADLFWHVHGRAI